MLTNTLRPAVERGNVKRELQDVGDVAAIADGWTNVAQDHYLTGFVIAEEIWDILGEFK